MSKADFIRRLNESAKEKDTRKEVKEIKRIDDLTGTRRRRPRRRGDSSGVVKIKPDGTVVKKKGQVRTKTVEKESEDKKNVFEEMPKFSALGFEAEDLDFEKRETKKKSEAKKKKEKDREEKRKKRRMKKNKKYVERSIKKFDRKMKKLKRKGKDLPPYVGP